MGRTLLEDVEEQLIDDFVTGDDAFTLQCLLDGERTLSLGFVHPLVNLFVILSQLYITSGNSI